jgi:hypothetical protein
LNLKALALFAFELACTSMIGGFKGACTFEFLVLKKVFLRYKEAMITYGNSDIHSTVTRENTKEEVFALFQ